VARDPPGTMPNPRENLAISRFRDESKGEPARYSPLSTTGFALLSPLARFLHAGISEYRPRRRWRSLVKGARQQVSLNLHNGAYTGLVFSRVEPGKVSKAPPRAASQRRLYCFKELVVFGSPAKARWEEELHAFLT
jgi:hypothetical protein